MDAYASIFDPIEFRARPGDRLRVVATNAGGCASITPLYLRCATGGEKRRLDDGFAEVCDAPDGVFYDKVFKI